MSQHGKWLNAFVAGMGVLPAAAFASSSQPAAYRLHDDHVLGTSLDVIAVADGAGTAALAASAVRETIRRLDPVLSGHNPDSELAHLNSASQPTPVSRDLFAVIEAAESWRARTDAGFSGRLGRVRDAWNDRSRGDRDADPGQAARKAEMARISLDATTHTIGRSGDMTFALDGIAKGYIIDAAMAAARRAAPGLSGLMIDIGGDIRCWGCGPSGATWRVGVAGDDLSDNAVAPAVLAVGNAAVASSGRGARDLFLDGVGFSHVFRAADGESAATVTRATVIADDATTADALSTAFVAMPPERSIAMADAVPGVETSIVMADGTRRESRGWAGFLAQDTARPAPATQLRLAQAGSIAGVPWPAGFSAAMDYEVPKMVSDNYRAPYVTIWITDEKRELVRTLLVLGNETRYLDSNFVWWRRYGRKDTALVDTIARPTRLPGRYTLTWDGKDDAGKPVPQGRYLIHTEATREHGGHSYVSGEITLGAQPAELSLPAKDELGPLHLRYGPGS